MTRTCVRCKKDISPVRLEVLPETHTCMECSTVQKYVGHMTFFHKTAPTLCYVRPENKEAVQQLRRSYQRARR